MAAGCDCCAVPYEIEEKARDTESSAVRLSETLYNDLPYWAGDLPQNPGATLHANRYGVEVGLSTISADEVDSELLVVLPTSSGR